MIDSHCHLDYWQADEITKVIANARNSGIDIIQTISTKISEFTKIESIVSQFDNIFCSIGNHPDNVSTERHIVAQDICDIVLKSPISNKIIGVGETGLDYYRTTEFCIAQKQQFCEHIRAGAILKMPVIIHSRAADDDTIDVISVMQKELNFTPLIHCFTGTMSFLQKLLDVGCYISYSGIVTFKNARDIADCAKYTPLDRILIETDAPFLAPVPMRGRKNEPSFIKHTAEFLANLHDLPIDDFVQITAGNFRKIFNIYDDRVYL